MRLKILACDLDGTLTEGHTVPDETWLALREAKSAGLTLILVTGRTMDLIDLRGPIGESFEAVVAENGAMVCLPRTESVLLPYGRVSTNVLDQLEAKGVPLARGMAIAATRVPHDKDVLDMVSRTGGSVTVEYNKGAVMILPPGATKGTGLQFSLNELGYSPHNVVAVGDAENDRSLFELAEVSVAVRNAMPEIRALADCVLPFRNGEGVRQLIQTLLSGQPLPHCDRPSRLLHLGRSRDDTPLQVDPSLLREGNVGVIGGSATGKSWMAGMVSELLLERNYQVCIVDPEGDHRGLRAFPHTLMLGGDGTRLPPVADVIAMSEYNNLSLVLDMSCEPVQARPSYVEALLRGLLNLRKRRGRPHWFLIDEAHAFCPPEGGSVQELVEDGMSDGGFCLVTYSPSRIAPCLLNKLDYWMLTGLKQIDEIETVRSYLANPACLTPKEAQRLASRLGRAALCQSNTCRQANLPGQASVFETARRVVPHVRHLQKYLHAPLPDEKSFYFRAADNSPILSSAGSLWDFRESLRQLPVAALRYHLTRGDFERWLDEVLRDKELARQVAKLARRPLDDAALRDALYGTVANRYEQLATLI